ncbi:hypothetical protein V3C99_014982 [Haemonchus contortus]
MNPTYMAESLILAHEISRINRAGLNNKAEWAVRIAADRPIIATRIGSNSSEPPGYLIHLQFRRPPTKHTLDHKDLHLTIPIVVCETSGKQKLIAQDENVPSHLCMHQVNATERVNISKQGETMGI